MLQVKDLRKVYKTKNGADVNALDGVTLQFPETGMVFLLGKSGSGKSTLLNVCGGLDAPTEGEIIVKGRSSKDFSQSDFDSYRNTFIGFIFQEYNILNEFSVEDNIALALELQGKSKDKAAIAALLEEVDLQGYAKRKPNTLSGGQKQRIAIARALIKAPEIIMADEPTGALDSNTGKQVFDTLKKLSHSKLVIVVSHDRDFAEQYGDRIIELKDGKILSDVTKTRLEQQVLSDNVNTLGDVLCIKKGAELTDKDFDKIKIFLKQSDNDVIIANNGQDIQNFKKISRISDDGGKEVFDNTDLSQAEQKQYTKEDSRFIRSKLPIRHAIKIGISGLRSKPVRLTFTVLLCTIAFTLFGLLSTLSFYNSRATFLQTMRDSQAPVLQLVKNYKATVTWYEFGQKQHDYESSMETRFEKTDLDELSATFGTQAFGVVRASGNFNLRQNGSQYWVNGLHGYGVLPENHALRQNINGAYPTKDDEIVISNYVAEMLYACNAYDANGEALVLSSAQDIIGKTIPLSGYAYKVVGILDAGAIPSEYEVLKENTQQDYSLIAKWNTYLNDGLQLVAFVSENHVETIAEERAPYVEGVHNYTYATVTFKQDGKYVYPEYHNAMYTDASSHLNGKTVISLQGNKTTPEGNEVVLSSQLFAILVRESYNRIYEQKIDDLAFQDAYYTVSELSSHIEMGGVYEHDAENKKDTFTAFTAEELQTKLNSLIKAVKRDKINLSFGMKLFDMNNQSPMGDTKELAVVGVYVAENTRYSNGYAVVSDTLFDTLWKEQMTSVNYFTTMETQYKTSGKEVYDTVYLPFVYSEETVDAYWNVYSNEAWGTDDTRINLRGSFVDNLSMVDSMVKSLSQIFLYVGLVLAVFAILLFSNFISVSISQKKREIGILRAVGARSADVFKIFFSESFAIALICMVLSTAASIFACGQINLSLADSIGASLFVFGIPSFGVMIAIALVTVVAATFLPVYNAARKKPVDSIRAL